MTFKIRPTMVPVGGSASAPSFFEHGRGWPHREEPRPRHREVRTESERKKRKAQNRARSITKGGR